MAFLPIFIVGFMVIRHFYRSDEKLMKLLGLWCVAASLVFYALFGYQNMLVLIISILWNINVVNVLRTKRARRGGSDSYAKDKFWLLIGIAVNVALLLFYKFDSSFFPVAISFYTFNQISFIVDFYRGDIEKFEILEYMNYILFFPKLLQGPLMGYEDFDSEFDKTGRAALDLEQVLRALLLISLGLFKKVILADTFGSAVDYGYENVVSLGSLEAVLVSVFYTLQLYFDFSGYCDVASGVCMMLGFDLALNFDSPYKAVSILDFWKRWHITLTKFFTKYLYIPLGGNRRGEIRTYINFMIIFLLSGLWHGNGLNFIIWGAMHGVMYVITRALDKHFAGSKFENRENGFNILMFFKVLFTFIYVNAAWVFFRAGSIREAITLFTRMMFGGSKAIATGMASCFQLDEIWYVIKVTPIMKLSFAWDICLWLFLIAGLIIVFFGKSAIRFAKKCKIGVMTTVMTAVLLIWCILSFGGVSTYLYMNF